MRYEGELCALAAACLWAFSGTAFGLATRIVGAFPTNQFRIVAAWPVLALLAFLVTGEVWPVGLSGERTALLLGSGLMGLVVGDIGYFHALAAIGPRLSSVIMATWPIFTLLAQPFTGEGVDLWALPGIVVTVIGVVLVLGERHSGAHWNPHLTPRQRWSGIVGALVAAFGQAIGVVLARAGMAAGPDLPGGVHALSTTFVRMTAGVVGIVLVGCLRRQPLAFRAIVTDRRAIAGALVGMACGPVLGVLSSMLAARHAARVEVASALMATTPLFLLPVAYFAYGARVGPRGLIGTLLSVGGAALLFLWS